ncbi:ribonuclease H-like domain-containing protein [Tanacetum coccineum]
MLRAASRVFPPKARLIPRAFGTVTITDPIWNMDTGASSHLNSHTSNLNTVYNKRLYPSVCVGDGKTIPVTNTGHSILSTLNRPLYLHNVLIILPVISSLDVIVPDISTQSPNLLLFLILCFLSVSLRGTNASGIPIGTFKPNPRFHGHTSHISPLPKSPSVALSDPLWRDAMYDEYNALIRNGTWILVLKPPNVNVVRSMWLFRHKYHADGSLSRYKARLVANGRNQQYGVDCSDTFSPVVKPATIHTVLSLVLTRNWPVHQLDVKNTFLNGYALRVGFTSSRCDSSLFIYQHGTEVAYLLIYVDDIVLTASSTALLQRIISSLHKEFDMTDLRALNYFLGISVTRDARGMFLSQKKYAMKLLERAHMSNCNATRTPVDTKSKLGSDGDPVSDSTLYRSLAGGLQYLTFTRLNISYVMQRICLHMHDPQEPHLAALKLVLRYVRGTLDFGLQLYASPTSSLVAYTDTDWAGCPTTRRFTSGYCVFFGDNLLSWSSKQQHTLSHSSVEADYRGVANVVAETTWLRNLLRELHTPLLSATLVYCDNVSTIYMTANPVQHQQTKHIEIDIHFVRDIVARGQL